MRTRQAEKMEIIRLVEDSDLPVRLVLEQLDVPKSTFYDWYRRYLEGGYDGLADRKSSPRRFWNPRSESDGALPESFSRFPRSPSGEEGASCPGFAFRACVEARAKSPGRQATARKK